MRSLGCRCRLAKFYPGNTFQRYIHAAHHNKLTMAFRFKLNEPVEKGFRRIGLEQIERAERQLSASESLEVATHETRKSLKRVRALLRLARPGLGDTIYRAENARFREIGALLSSARDSDVVLETVT